jgi:hypothetical protein
VSAAALRLPWYDCERDDARKHEAAGALVSDFVVEPRADTLGLLGQVVANHLGFAT